MAWFSRAVGAAAGLALLVGACTTNPATGRSQLAFVSDQQLVALSADAWSQVKAQTPVYRNEAAQNRLQRVGSRVARAAGLDPAGCEFVVFDSAERNAFVLPGCKMGVYRGLMDLAATDDQLAAVLGHETGHVTARHAAERYSQSTLAQVGMSAGQIALGGSQRGSTLAGVLGLGLQYGVLMPYSRLQESEADRIGVDYMVQAGYDADASVAFWERMIAADGGGSRPPEFLSTHPDPVNRIAALRAYIREKGY